MSNKFDTGVSSNLNCAGRKLNERGHERAGQPVHPQLREDRRCQDGVQPADHIQVQNDAIRSEQLENEHYL